jgi:hypothetical protein
VAQGQQRDMVAEGAEAWLYLGQGPCSFLLWYSAVPRAPWLLALGGSDTLRSC